MAIRKILINTIAGGVLGGCLALTNNVLITLLGLAMIPVLILNSGL